MAPDCFECAVRSGGLTTAGLAAGTLVGSALQSWLRVDIVPIGVSTHIPSIDAGRVCQREALHGHPNSWAVWHEPMESTRGIWIMNMIIHGRVHRMMQCAGIFKISCSSLTASYFAGAPFSFSTSGRVFHYRHVADLFLFGMMADWKCMVWDLRHLGWPHSFWHDGRWKMHCVGLPKFGYDLALPCLAQLSFSRNYLGSRAQIAIYLGEIIVCTHRLYYNCRQWIITCLLSNAQCK